MAPSPYGKFSEEDFRILNVAFKMLQSINVPQIDHAVLAGQLHLGSHHEARQALQRIFDKMRWFSAMGGDDAAAAAAQDKEILSEEEFHVLDLAFKPILKANRPVLDHAAIFRAQTLGSAGSSRERWRQICTKQGWFNVKLNGSNRPAPARNRQAPVRQGPVQETIEDRVLEATRALNEQVNARFAQYRADPDNQELFRAYEASLEEYNRLQEYWKIHLRMIQFIRRVLE